MVKKATEVAASSQNLLVKVARNRLDNRGAGPPVCGSGFIEIPAAAAFDCAPSLKA